MPAWTVTVCASGSSTTTSSIDFKNRKLCVLSAMLLKQWRVPSTFSLLFDAQASRGEITELASSAAKRLIKVLLFMAIAQAVSTLAGGISCSLASKTRQLYTHFLCKD